MKLKDVIAELDLEVVVAGDLEVEVSGGYSCDLLSNVMAQAKAGDVWFTVQGHQNTVAISLLVDLAAIVVVEDLEIEEKTIERAREKEVTILSSPQSAYQLAGQLYQLGID
ncbi:DRTGG domain-containing protein [Halanaerobaculum tunisiense]